jgi:hypothetical protein
MSDLKPRVQTFANPLDSRIAEVAEINEWIKWQEMISRLLLTTRYLKVLKA